MIADDGGRHTNNRDAMSGVEMHIAGLDIEVGRHLRQRCGWCGKTLIDYDLDRIAIPVGQDPRPSCWPVGAIVAEDGPMSYTVDHNDDDPLPPECCGQLDYEVTR